MNSTQKTEIFFFNLVTLPQLCHRCNSDETQFIRSQVNKATHLLCINLDCHFMFEEDWEVGGGGISSSRIKRPRADSLTDPETTTVDDLSDQFQSVRSNSFTRYSLFTADVIRGKSSPPNLLRSKDT